MKEYISVMLISPDVVKRTGELNYNVDDTVIGSAIRSAQNIYLKDVIGTALLERIQELVWNSIQESDIMPTSNGNSIDDPENEMYKVLLDEYIENVLVYKCLVEITTRISFKIRNVGVSQNSEENINASSLSDIKYIKNGYETLFCDALNRMMDFLENNKAAFPEIDSKCACSKTKPRLNERYANTGLYLGK